MLIERQGLQTSPTRCCKAAPSAVSEASLNMANIAGGYGWARSVAREGLALQSLKAWTMVGVHSTGCDPLISVKWRMYAGGLWYEPPVNIEHAKETSEVFDQGRPLETVYRRTFLLQGPSTFS